MIPELRRQFNARFTPELYRRFLQRLDERCGVPVTFRNCETPCFFPAGLIGRMAQAGRELAAQIVGNPHYLAAADATIPPEYRVANDAPRPLFVQADFGLVREGDGTLAPKLVEIQGFPSLYAYQPELAATYADTYELHPGLDSLLLPRAAYQDQLRRAILADHDPENTVLLEIDPWHQKTAPDFLLTQRLFGIPVVDVTDVRRQGSKLFYPRAGRQIPIARIYNRVIVDELVRKHVPLSFDFRDDLNVEWAGHPNWFYRLSKFSLPYLQHACMPQTEFFTRIPPNPHDYVLKPLFSFAGLGVIVGPTTEQLQAIPVSERGGYILQERMHFEPVIETPHGITNAEVRIMYLWLDELEAVTTIVRMGRGKMMGVDHNRDLEWVGASSGFMLP